MKAISGSSDLPKMSIKTRDDTRYSTSSRRLSSEMTIHHSSVDQVYYGGVPVAVPFKWESQPGTPRVRFRETPLPPLTPPPSYLFNTPKTPSKKISKSKGGILNAVLPRLSSTRKSHNSPVSPASSESSSLFSRSSCSDSASSYMTPNNHRQSRRKSFEDRDRYGSPVSTLCFRFRRSGTPQPHDVSKSGPL